MRRSHRKLRASSAVHPSASEVDRKKPRLLSAKDIRATLRITDAIRFRSRYAYFTLVSTNDSVPGALVLGWSLKRTKTVNDCVAMVVPEINRRERTLLRKLFDRVVEVKTIMQSFTSPKVGCLTMEERIAYSRKMTKFNVFKFIEYEKVLLVDSSTYILRNIDEIFQLNAPAGISSLVDSQNQSKFHGINLSKEHVTKSLKLSHGIRGHMLLLAPNLSNYLASRSNTTRYRQLQFVQPDVEFLSKLFRSRWTHIHSKFATMPWQANTIKASAYGVCLEGFNPWDDTCKDSDDILRWRLKAITMCRDVPQIMTAFMKRRWFFEVQEEIVQQTQACWG